MHMARAVALMVMATSVAMAEEPTRKLSPYDSDPPNRITGQFEASAGLFMSLGGSLAYERRVYHDLGLLARVGYASATSILDENAGADTRWRDLVIASTGVRYYGVRAYVFTELGVAVLHNRAYTERPGTDEEKHHAAKTLTLPSIAMGFGGKPGGVLDIGIAATFPTVGVQLHFGWDFKQF
jgi:hypothetical protein